MAQEQKPVRKTVAIQDERSLDRARDCLKRTLGVDHVSDSVVATAALEALCEKLDAKMVPASHALKMASTMANEAASRAIVAVIKSFFEDLHPDADAVHVAWQPVSGMLRVVIDDGEPLVFAPEPEGVTDDDLKETIQ